MEGWQPETQPVKHCNACRLTWVDCCRFYNCVQCDCMILYCNLFIDMYIKYIYIYTYIYIYLLGIARVYMSSFATASSVFLSLSLRLVSSK